MGTVIGIDPGGITGIVAGKWASGRFVTDWCGERQFEDVGRELAYYSYLFVQHSVESVYCETFSLRTAVTSPDVLSPVIVRTIVECALFSVRGMIGVVGLAGVSPSVAKSSVTDERLRRWGYWHTGSSHIRDAYRQVLVHRGR